MQQDASACSSAHSRACTTPRPQQHAGRSQCRKGMGTASTTQKEPMRRKGGCWEAKQRGRGCPSTSRRSRAQAPGRTGLGQAPSGLVRGRRPAGLRGDALRRAKGPRVHAATQLSPACAAPAGPALSWTGCPGQAPGIAGGQHAREGSSPMVRAQGGAGGVATSMGPDPLTFRGRQEEPAPPSTCTRATAV